VLRRKRGLPDDAPILLWIGRVHPEKGLPVLLEAVSAPHWKACTCFWLALTRIDFSPGSSARRPLANRLLDGYDFSAGSIRRARLSYSGWRRLSVFPSRKENFGLSAAEAVASGLPAVLTDGCGLAPVIDGLAGICVSTTQGRSREPRQHAFSRQLLRRLRAGTVDAAQKLDCPPVVAYLEAVYQRALV
jgi:glycosyltransferase involved in cell wall biosynthesis